MSLLSIYRLMLAKDMSVKDNNPDQMLKFIRNASGDVESNIDPWKEYHHARLVAKYGQAANFIIGGKYFQHPMPPAPDYRGLPAESEEAEQIKSDNGKLRGNVIKENWTLESMRTPIFIDTMSWIGEGAKARIRCEAGFADVEAECKDPLKLIEMAVKAMTTATAGNSTASIMQARRALEACKQPANMRVSDYLKLFKACSSRLDRLEDKSYTEAMLADTFLRNLDKGRYSSLNLQLLHGIIKTPATLDEAYQLAFLRSATLADAKESQRGYAAEEEDEHIALLAEAVRKRLGHKSKPSKPDGGGKASGGASGGGSDKVSSGKVAAAVKVSSGGGGGGGRDSKKRAPVEKPFPFGSCRRCGRFGHFKKDCKEDTTDEELALQAQEQEEDENGWSAVCVGAGCVPEESAMLGSDTVNQRLASMHAFEIGLDSQCTSSLFGERRLLTDVRDCEATFFKGVGGRTEVNQVGTHEHFGRVYFKEGMPNLLPLSYVRDNADALTYTREEDVFRVSINGGEYEFGRQRGGRLYTCNVSGDLLEPTVDTDGDGLQAWAAFHDSVEGPETLVETVAGNERLYTKKQVEAAARAKAFMGAMGFQGIQTIIEIVRSGRVPVDFTVEDVLRAQSIWASQEATRGKTTRKKTTRAPSKVAGSVVDADLTMHVDIAFFAGVGVLMAMFKPLGLMMCEWIKSRSTGDVRAAIERQKARVTAEGYKVVEVTSDTEGAVVALQPELEAMGCRVSIHPPSTDSAEADVAIKQLKNGVRAITVLPYLLPIALLMYAVYFACAKINMVPSSTTAHNFSPMEMFLGRSISLERDLGARRGGLPLAFGSRVEVFEATTNTMADRTRPAIFLGSKGNSYGSANFFMLDTQKVVARDQWKALPMDVGTIDIMYEIVRKGKLLPKRVPVFFRGVELTEEPSQGEPAERSRAHTRVVTDSGNSMPDPTAVRQGFEQDPREYEVVPADELYERAPRVDPLAQLEAEPTAESGAAAAGANGGETSSRESELRALRGTSDR